MTPLLETLARLQSASGIEGFLATLAIKGTLVLALGFAAALCLRRAPAAARHLAWCATFAGLLLLPALALWAPPVALPLLPAAADGLSDGASTAGPSPAGELSAPVDPSALAVPARSPSPGERPPAAPPSPALRWGVLLPAAYLAGAAALLAYLVAGGLQAHRLRRGARKLDAEPGWRNLLTSLRAALGIGRHLSVEASDRVAVPLAWGLRRPTVLLPAAAEGWDDSQRRDVLVHELAHVARHDWLAQLGARVVCALYWFHPLAWIAARRLVLEAERACDDRVLAAGGDSCDYAERLLRIAGAARSARDPSYAAVAMARRSDLATRIQAILDARVRRGVLRRAHAALLAGVLLLPAGFLASATLARADAAGGAERVDPRIDRGFDSDLDQDRNHDVDREDDSGGDRRADRGLPALLEAAGRGLEAEVRRLIAAGADLDEAVAGRGTALIRAAAAGDAEIVRLLLDAGADPDRIETSGSWEREVPRSPLGAAARSGAVEVAELLLDRGARVDLTPRGDASPLMIAAGRGHEGLVRLLLARGADPNRVVEGDGTPLIAAVRGGEVAVVRLLLAEGAEPDVYVEGDESPLYHAIEGGDPEIVRLLLDYGADPNAEWPGDGNPIIVATAERRGDLVELLIGAGADVDRGVRGDGNALIQAAGRGDIRTVRRLLAAGADPDAAVEGDGSPLIQAADAGYLEIVRLLADEGADLDRMVPGDENPLIRAAGAGHLEVVRFLLDRGADPNVRTVEAAAPPWRPEPEVRTPLLQARRGGHDDVVRLLLARGARE